MTSLIRKPFRYRFNNAVYILIGINILVYLLQRLLADLNLMVYFSMIPLMVRQGWIWQFVTYMFVHDPSSMSHILFNMIGLLIFGGPVERRMGSTEFLLYYFLTGILAGFFSFILYWFTGAYMVFLMGASGAVFAVELAYAALFPEALILVWGILPLRAPLMVLGYTAIELFSMFFGFRGNVAHATHLAGFAFGWLYFILRFGVNPWRAMWRR